MNAKPLSREQRILDWLAANPDGATLPVLHAAVEPTIPPTRFGATLANLLRRNKIQRTGQVRGYVYRLADVAPIDRRRRGAKATAARPTATARQQIVRPKIAPVSPPASIPAAAALSLTTLPTAPARRGDVDAKQVDRDAIARDIAAFQKAGGKIQKLRWGEHSQSGKSLAQQQSEYLASRERSTEIPRHRRAKSAA